jgi:hypothetical protein
MATTPLRVAARLAVRASRPVVTGFALAAIISLIQPGHSRAAGAAVCDGYAKEAAAKAQGVRDLACGYDLKDPLWTTSRKSHANWCRANPENAVVAETARRRGEISICAQCRAYADFAVKSEAENEKRNCGFSGPRWNAAAAEHFGWCMALRGDARAADLDIPASYKTIFEKIEQSTHSETLERIVQIAACKSPTPK